MSKFSKYKYEVIFCHKHLCIPWCHLRYHYHMFDLLLFWREAGACVAAWREAGACCGVAIETEPSVIFEAFLFRRFIIFCCVRSSYIISVVCEYFLGAQHIVNQPYDVLDDCIYIYIYISVYLSKNRQTKSGEYTHHLITAHWHCSSQSTLLYWWVGDNRQILCLLVHIGIYWDVQTDDCINTDEWGSCMPGGGTSTIYWWGGPLVL